MKKIRYIYTTLIVVCMCFLNFVSIKAATAYISGGGTIYVGDTATVTVTASGGCKSYTYSINSSNSSVLKHVSGESEPMGFSDASNTLSFEAKSAGTATVSFYGQVSDGVNDKNVSGSVTFYVKERSKPSNNNGSSNSGNGSSSQNNNNNTPSNTDTPKSEPNDTTSKKKEEKKNSYSSLASLSVSEGKLSPAFKSDTTSYKLDLPGTVTSLNVKATANDSKASISGTGEKKVKPGDNTIQVFCTAEDGTSTAYTIKAHVDEKPLVFVNYDGKKLGVSRANASLTKKLFEETKIKIDGKEVPAWKNDSLKMTLLYLENGDKKDFYFYDTEKQEVTSIYRPMGLLGENIAIIDVPKHLQKRTGMTFTTVKIDGKEMPGWTYDDKAFANYALIYVMNDAGDQLYYQYEKKDNTLQRYSGGAALTQEAYEKLLKKQEEETKQLKHVIYGLGGACVLLLIALIIALLKKRKPKHFDKIDTGGRILSKGAEIEHKTLVKMKQEDGENF